MHFAYIILVQSLTAFRRKQSFLLSSTELMIRRNQRFLLFSERSEEVCGMKFHNYSKFASQTCRITLAHSLTIMRIFIYYLYAFHTSIHPLSLSHIIFIVCIPPDAYSLTRILPFMESFTTFSPVSLTYPILILIFPKL